MSKKQSQSFGQFWLLRLVVAFALLPYAIAQPSKPTISALVNVASYVNGPISPGEMVAIFGSGMGPPQLVDLQLDAQGNVASTLAGVQVLFDGTPAPLIYVSQTQIAAMVPYNVAAPSTTQVQVMYAGTSSDRLSKQVAASAPGIFSADASGQGQGAIANSDGSPNSTTNPASPGAFVTFYLTGVGQTDPPGTDGNIATTAANIRLTVSGTIAGRPMQVLYAGAAPGNVDGFAQINAVIPADLQYGGSLPMNIQIGDASSQAQLTLAVSGPPAPLPAPPVLQASAISSSQIDLSWASAATGIVRFHLERRIASGTYSEINQPGPTTTSFDDVGLNASTTYFYRMRVETAAGLSPFSNEVNVATLQGLPAAPSNLQALVLSSTQISLTWTNNAPDATTVRVESQRAGSTTFTDIGAAATLTTTGISNLQPNTAYSFRVRAQNPVGFSAYSNTVTATTPSAPKTIFLLHGIGQGYQDMQGLYGSLTGPLGVDLTRFIVNYGFDFSECAAVDSCPANCSITSGAQKLAQYIISAKPPGDIVLIGFSMGGLIARDMMANNWSGVLNGRKVAALITLGTPNLGYPYTRVDSLFMCTPLVQEMNGNWRSEQAQNIVVLSPYLLALTSQQWPSLGFPGLSGRWLAASGRSCSNPTRILDSTTGCRDSNPFSDGVVCNDSAVYNTTTTSGTAPVYYWQDPGQIYVHSNGVGGLTEVLCNNSGNPTLNPPLSNPPSFGPLFSAIMGVLNGL